MKKKKLNKKLALNKETITEIGNQEMSEQKGGTGSRRYPTCEESRDWCESIKGCTSITWITFTCLSIPFCP
jgi:hypothetical protein